MIYLQSYTFDPLESSPERSNQLGVQASDQDADYTIIQFTKSLTRAERDRLQADYGLQLKEYIPKFAYLERVNAQTLAALHQDPLFRASTPFQPDFKVSSEIGNLRLRTAERQAMEGLSLRAVLFPEVEPTAVVSQLAAAAARDLRVLDDRALGGSLQIQFLLPSRASLPTIAQIAGIRWIEEVAEVIEDNGFTAGTMQSGTAGDESIWDLGIHGEGQMIGIIDSNVVDIDHCWFRDSVNNTPNPAHRKVVGIRNASGSAAGSHATFVAGIAAGDDVNNPGADANRGNAWAARISYGNNRDLSSASMLALLTAAAADGAHVHTNSWHLEPTPQYDQIAADVDTFVWNHEEHLILGSSGNVGEAIGPPGTAKNALCVSATQRHPNEMSFGDGNSGPTPDGRRKPDLFAPGCAITSAQAGTACSVSLRGCATSWATPAAAAAAILVRQYYTEGWYPSGTHQATDARIPSGALLKATLLNSTIDMSNIAGYPNDQEGWGLIRLDNALFFQGDRRKLMVSDVRNANGLNTGESQRYSVYVGYESEPLKVTLVWSDPPAASGVADPVINNLDLIVTSPDGSQTFLGNHFIGGESAVGGVADDRNNVEMVQVNHAMPGEWSVTVRATEVNLGHPGQGYALVVTGDLVAKPCEISVPIALKIPVYTAAEIRNRPVVCTQGYTQGDAHQQADPNQEEPVATTP
jgi:uncharacterized protein YfaP (DUF2135 family)